MPFLPLLVPIPRDAVTDATPYNPGDKIQFKLVMTQNLSEPFDILVTDVYDQDRPELTRDGDLIPYRKKVAELVKIKDQKLQIFSEVPMSIEPGKPSPIATIDLDQWFGGLKVGHYQLRVR